MKFFYLAISVIIMCSAPSPLKAQASHNLDLYSLVVEKNQKMEVLLQKRNPRETINFLHEHVKEGAIFNIELDNPTLTKHIGKKTIKIGKAAYINSFIQGLSYIDDYEVKINTNHIQVSEDKKSAKVTETMIENGVISRFKDPIAFNSKTTCITTYTIDGGLISSSKADCKVITGKTNAI